MQINLESYSFYIKLGHVHKGARILAYIVRDGNGWTETVNRL